MSDLSVKDQLCVEHFVGPKVYGVLWTQLLCNIKQRDDRFFDNTFYLSRHTTSRNTTGNIKSIYCWIGLSILYLNMSLLIHICIYKNSQNEQNHSKKQ